MLAPYEVIVLRIGHRPRDFRLTTHVALTARAFGANGMILADAVDPKIEATVKKVVDRWGGPFRFEMGVPSVPFIEGWKARGGEVIHLTMYGLDVDDLIDVIRSSRGDKLVIVGSAKVPREYFKLADYNVAVGHQPHSEVAALALFLERLYKGQGLRKEFKDAKLKVVPTARGKRVIKLLN